MSPHPLPYSHEVQAAALQEQNNFRDAGEERMRGAATRFGLPVDAPWVFRPRPALRESNFFLYFTPKGTALTREVFLRAKLEEDERDVIIPGRTPRHFNWVFDFVNVGAADHTTRITSATGLAVKLRGYDYS